VTVTYPGAGSQELMTAIGIAAMTLAGLALFIFSIANIIDCQERNFPDNYSQRRWTLIMLFLPVIGAVAYRIWGQKYGDKQGPAFPRY
jgi:hypothetical protein